MFTNICAGIGFIFLASVILGCLNMCETVFYVGTTKKVLITEEEYKQLLIKAGEENTINDTH